MPSATTMNPRPGLTPIVARLVARFSLVCAWALTCGSGWGQSQTPGLPAAGSASPIGAPGAPGFEFKELRPGVFRFGSVTLNKTQRSVTFPVSINMRTGVVEYAVVTAAGKTHESVFRTGSEPKDIHAALLLLGVRPADTNEFPSDLAAPIPGERVGIEVSWKDGTREIRQPLENFIVTISDGQTLIRGPWIYNGSHFLDGRFAAQLDGSIISVHIDPAALINNPRPGRENDDLHYVNTRSLPASDTAMEITVRLLDKSRRKPAGARALPPWPGPFLPPVVRF